jgi:predicted enzyme related to lactoylglutathione lyase
MDTSDGEHLGRFWADVAGLSFQPGTVPGDEAGNLTGADEGQGIAMCQVPEPRTVKHRVHLDVYAATIDDLVARGATVLLPSEESGFRWTVMTDPEGGEFCAFLREPAELPAYRVHGLVVDSADPRSLCAWWGEVFGVEPRGETEHGWSWLEGVPGLPILTMDFVPVPEPKTVKNRIHWDVYADARDLEAAGATLLRAEDDEISWHVMADPEGNEFCVFEPR